MVINFIFFGFFELSMSDWYCVFRIFSVNAIDAFTYASDHIPYILYFDLKISFFPGIFIDELVKKKLILVYFNFMNLDILF